MYSTTLMEKILTKNILDKSLKYCKYCNLIQIMY